MSTLTSRSEGIANDENRGPLFLGIVTTVVVISTLLFIARMYTRIKVIKIFWWDDAFLLLAVIVSVSEYITQVIIVRHGYGRHVSTIDPPDLLYVGKIFFISELVWVWVVSLIKTSMALLLLRIRRDWMWGMVPLAAFQIIISIGVTGFQFKRCAPIAADWNPMIPDAKCVSVHGTETGVYVMSALFVMNDVIFASLPFTFIYMVQRPLREKILVLFLMGFGLFASVCAIVKMVMIHNLLASEDYTYDGVPTGIFAHLESNIGIIAACLACLKAPFQQLLNRVGVKSKNSTSSQEFYPKYLVPDSDENSTKQQRLNDHLDAASSPSEFRTDSVGKDSNKTDSNQKQPMFITNQLDQFDLENQP